jgi:hypothetical protein
MPTITVLANGAQFYVRDATAYRNDARFAVGDDQQQATGTTTGTGGVAIDPTVSQSQWLLNYLLAAKDRGISQFGADTSRMNTVGSLANTQYGNETSRAGVVGNLYSSLFGTPANYGAVSNLMRGQPNASGLSFWNALSRGSHLGEGATDPRGQLHNVNPDQVISDLFGGVAASGRPKASSSSNSGGASLTHGAGSAPGPVAASYGAAGVAHGAGHVPGPVGYAGGGDIVVEHPATLHLADGRVIPIGEYGRPEQLTVTPLATNPLPPRYYAGLMPGSQHNGRVFHSEMIGSNTAGDNQDPLYGVPPNQTDQFGQAGVGPNGVYQPSSRPDDTTNDQSNPIPNYRPGTYDQYQGYPFAPTYSPANNPNTGIGMATGGTLPLTDAENPAEAGLPTEEPDVTNPTPDPRTLAEITAVLHTPPALHPSPIEAAIRANWTLDARGHPQFTGARPQAQQAPQAAGLLPGMATGGALTFGGGAPAVLYPGATARTSAGPPSDTGQVTSAGTHAGQTSTGPYYNRSPWNDPRYAQTADIENLSPLEKSLLESTSAAMGEPASEWWAVYQRSRPSFQNAAVGAGFTRAA